MRAKPPCVRPGRLACALLLLAPLAVPGCLDGGPSCKALAALQPGPPIARHPLLLGSDQEIVEALGRAVGDEPLASEETPGLWQGRNGTFNVVRSGGGDVVSANYALQDRPTPATEDAMRAELRRVLQGLGLDEGRFVLRTLDIPGVPPVTRMLASHRMGPFFEAGAVHLEVGTPLADGGQGQTYRLGPLHEDTDFEALGDGELAWLAEGHARCGLQAAGKARTGAHAKWVGDAVVVLAGTPRLDVVLALPDPCGTLRSVSTAVELDPRTGALVYPTSGWGRCIGGD